MRQAWKTLQREAFPLLISDWEMPELNGLELCRAVRARDAARDTYLILLASLTDPASYQAARETGIDDFITKPFDQEDLAVRLRVAERVLAAVRNLRRTAFRRRVQPQRLPGEEPTISVIPAPGPFCLTSELQISKTTSRSRH